MQFIPFWWHTPRSVLHIVGYVGTQFILSHSSGPESGQMNDLTDLENGADEIG